ncbi:phosphate ABC transporter permease PstA [Ornithinicoccus halotolerans]|uniref:phosphate ABC transporter permease PstA n=1 Tax=Ornithinicoccus halotolerans TaxID=1748220 RepID=UPI0012964DC1|nr:phosphate ABC transporter permease PstA [Ornithinicoccus halotolerans]
MTAVNAPTETPTETDAAPGLESHRHLGTGATWGLTGAGLAGGALLGLLAGSWAVGAVAGLLLVLVALPGVSWRVEGARRGKDRAFTVVVTVAFLLALLPLLSLIYSTLTNGLARFDPEFFTSDMRAVLGEGGGALHAIVGTLLITGSATLISVPIGIMCAIYLVEYGKGRLARMVTILVDVMTGIPSIVAGLFAFALFSIFFGPSIRFGLGGAVALSLLMVPVVVRSVEEMLKLVANELREASYALGVPRWRTIVKVVLPTAGAGIAAGVTIAIARVIGETAPLLIIAGSTTNLDWNIFEGRMMTLPVFTYESYMIPGVPPEPGVDRAWAAALTLMVIVMGLNLAARLIARLFGTKSR